MEGVTAIETWMIVCIHFVFGALCCYAYLLWRLKPSTLKKKWKRICSGSNAIHSSDEDDDGEDARGRARRKKEAEGNNEEQRGEVRGGFLF